MIDIGNIAPRPWTVEETPNGHYLRASNGIKLAIMLGKPELRAATAEFIAEMANGRWLQLVSARSSEADLHWLSEDYDSPCGDDGDGRQSQPQDGD